MKYSALIILIVFAAIVFSSSPAYAQWEYRGKLISGESWIIMNPSMSLDGEGGVLLAWQDYRNSNNADVYVQKVDTGGVELWPHDGILACQSLGSEMHPLIVPNGYGGAIVVWDDIRTSPYYIHIYAQNITSDGTLLWPDTGIAVVTTQSDRALCGAEPDGHGGAVILCEYPCMAQRIDSLGNLLYPDGGLLMTDSSYSQMWAKLVKTTTDSSFAAVWNDSRGFYAQKFTLDGQRLWNPQGVPIVSDTINVYWENYKISAAPNGGIYVCWSSTIQWLDGQGRMRFDPSGMQIPQVSAIEGLYTNYDGRAIFGGIYCNVPPPWTGIINIVDTSGTLEWPNHLIFDNNTVSLPAIVQSIPGEFAFIAEMAALSSRNRALKYNMTNGFVWGDTGVGYYPDHSAYHPQAISDGLGGLYIAWKSSEHYTVYLTRVYANGWVAPDTTDGIIEDNQNLPRDYIRIKAYPNPFNSTTSISYDIPKASDVTLAIFDILGRKVATLVNGHQTDGHHDVIWNAAANSSEIYFAKATSGQGSGVIKLIYLK